MNFIYYEGSYKFVSVCLTNNCSYPSNMINLRWLVLMFTAFLCLSIAKWILGFPPSSTNRLPLHAPNVILIYQSFSNESTKAFCPISDITSISFSTITLDTIAYSSSHTQNGSLVHSYQTSLMNVLPIFQQHAYQVYHSIDEDFQHPFVLSLVYDEQNSESISNEGITSLLENLRYDQPFIILQIQEYARNNRKIFTKGYVHLSDVMEFPKDRSIYQAIHLADLFPTLLIASGIPIPLQSGLKGKNVWPVLTGTYESI